jgi:hypothetical protein
MKNVILCVLVYLLSAYRPNNVTAHINGSEVKISEAQLNEYISVLYRQIDFEPGAEVNPEVFQTAYRGYLNLKQAGKLNDTVDVLSICDFSKPSSEYRLWIIDLAERKVRYHTYVAHGQGSGEAFAQAFSNRMNSHQSSLGFYVTGETYNGKHGLSLRLHGMDRGYNSAALERGIVVHGADYVCNSFVNTHNRLGRSWGCPAVASELSADIIETIKDGTCLFVYYPDKNYLASSAWLKKTPNLLPTAESLPMLPVAQRVYISLDSFQKQQQTVQHLMGDTSYAGI